MGRKEEGGQKCAVVEGREHGGWKDGCSCGKTGQRSRQTRRTPVAANHRAGVSGDAVVWKVGEARETLRQLRAALRRRAAASASPGERRSFLEGTGPSRVSG